MKNDVSKRKKTSKEKRALIGALCIAAAVAAGSTFAWFSSVDEVTNRLSANAAYDVSIIETFTPPTNWIPGQKVNKDTAAVNTGNIPAFVKQKLEGKMRVTMEEAVDTFTPSPDKTYIELTEDELDSIEAGGFLAWASNGRDEANRIGYERGTVDTITSKQCYLGEVSAVHSGADFDDMKSKSDYYSKIQFAPPATGDYIFRRVINVFDKTDDLEKEYGSETYEYAGYHYDDKTGKYYKIKVINGLQPGEDGILQDAPTVYYGVEKNDIQTLPLRYEEIPEEKNLLYIPNGQTQATKVPYKTVTLNTSGVDGSKFTVYSINRSGPFYCVVTDKGDSDLELGDVYTFANPLGDKLGHVYLNANGEYTEEKEALQRLVATYPVGKSDDIFIGESTELSDETADKYDSERKAIAKSDYLKAKVEFENKKAQYELNKAAYDAAVALLTALKENEEKIIKKNTDAGSLGVFNGTINEPNFTCTDTSDENREIKNRAATKFANQISNVNSAAGSYTGDPLQIEAVKNFVADVNDYKSAPSDANWNDVLSSYQTVTNRFTAINSRVSEFEAAIVDQWKKAGVNSGITDTANDIANFTVTGNISDDAITVKYAANQLIAWERQLAAYQNAVNKYFKTLSDFQSNSKYALQDVRPLNAAYKAAVGAKADKKKTDTTNPNVRATEIQIDNGSKIEVSPDYYITVNSHTTNELALHNNDNAPIKNTISQDGYAGAAEISGITGDSQFMIGNIIPVANVNDTNPKPANVKALEDKLNELPELENEYNKAKNLYNKYESEHTNQDTNNDIVIYINLDNVSTGGTVNANEWKLSPTLVAGAKEANFYYTSILGAGEQTKILVDSLELSGDTTNVAFKDFDFDLNVTVDSSQVVVSEDGNFYESTAVMANDAFKVKPSKFKYDKKPETDADKIVDWT